MLVIASTSKMMMKHENGSYVVEGACFRESSLNGDIPTQFCPSGNEHYFPFQFETTKFAP